MTSIAVRWTAGTPHCDWRLVCNINIFFKRTRLNQHWKKSKEKGEQTILTEGVLNH